MDIYERMYYMLFNRVTDALEALERGETDKVKEILIKSQTETEEMFVSHVPS